MDTKSREVYTQYAPPPAEWFEKNQEVYFIDIRGMELDLDNPAVHHKLNDKILEILKEKLDIPLPEPVLLKTHIGEPRCTTRLRPELIKSSVDFLKGKGIEKMVTGDTTVIYSSPRGWHENPHSNETPYTQLAKDQGYSVNGATGLPFVILDRPATAVPGVLEFQDEEIALIYKNPPGRFRRFFIAGGFYNAKSLITHAHFTLHYVAPYGACTKTLTMGGGGKKGKEMMHQAFHPQLNTETCYKCGSCFRTCPEGAITWQKGELPRFNFDLCVGCGECGTVCPGGTKTLPMVGDADPVWERGRNTMATRLADFLVGAMEGKWEQSIHILHLYRITELCDCMNMYQKPLCEDIGILIGRVPFMVDYWGFKLFQESMRKLPPTDSWFVQRVLHSEDDAYDHLMELMGLHIEPDLKKIPFNIND